MARKRSKAPKSDHSEPKKPELQYGVWQPVYSSQEELDADMSEFSKAVSEDIRALASARRHSEELLMQGF